jgi:hypothetical protein
VKTRDCFFTRGPFIFRFQVLVNIDACINLDLFFEVCGNGPVEKTAVRSFKESIKSSVSPTLLDNMIPKQLDQAQNTIRQIVKSKMFCVYIRIKKSENIFIDHFFGKSTKRDKKG